MDHVLDFYNDLHIDENPDAQEVTNYENDDYKLCCSEGVFEP